MLAFYEFQIARVQFLKIGCLNALFIFSTALFYIFQKSIGILIQINIQIWLWQFFVHDSKKLFIKGKLNFGERYLRKNQRFVYVIIRNYTFLKKIELRNIVHQLLVAVCQKRHFQRKGITRRIFIKFRKKWIVLKTFEN